MVEICRRLDGIPLAIELAAPRARAIDVTEIARRLDERFRLLRGVRRGSDPRHRTLEDAISWSYDLLGDDEKRLFAALAVFAGQFDLDAAEEICRWGPSDPSADGGDVADDRDRDHDNDDDVLDLLTRLTERSMLAVRRPSTGGTRYELRETLREFGRSRLDGDRSVELFAAHAAHHASVAASVATEQQTEREGSANGRAAAAFADLRAAQRFALQVEDFDVAFRLIGSIREYAMRAMRYEALTWADAAARLPGGRDHELHPLVSAAGAYGAWVRGEFETALSVAYAARAGEERQGRQPSGLVERVLANVLFARGQVEVGHRETTRQVDLAEESGSGSRLAHACYFSSVAASSVGERPAGPPGPPRDGLQRARRGGRHLYRAGEWSQQWHTLARCVIALDRIGQPELALMVVGAIEAWATIGTPPVTVILRDVALDTRDRLVVQLGPEPSAELRRIGAGLPVAEVVHRTRQALLGRSPDT